MWKTSAVSHAISESAVVTNPQKYLPGKVPMNELVVISGKGGTGKTSLLAAFAALAQNAVLADTDVDAADLHLIMNPTIKERHRFTSGWLAVIRQEICRGCGLCQNQCRFDAIEKEMTPDGMKMFHVDPSMCEGCGVCRLLCPSKAIELQERPTGEWFVSNTRFGPMVHAHLLIGAGNSGKLVGCVRNASRQVAEREKRNLLLVDGPPGIGCPVIASITGATAVLIVTEPTVAGEHDLARIIKLVRHFGIQPLVCINKWDLSPLMTERIKALAVSQNAQVVGTVPYTPSVSRAQVKGVTIMEFDDETIKGHIRKVWETVCQHLPTRK